MYESAYSRSEGVFRQCQESVEMSDKRYVPAGWAAIAMAVLFPAGFVIGIIQGIIGKAMFDYQGPTLGPSDLIFLIFTVLGVYTLLMLRNLLNERYDFHKVDLLIVVAVWWNVLFQVSLLALKTIYFLIVPSPLIHTVLTISFMSIAMVTGGIIDILLAIRLLEIRDAMSDLLKVYVYMVLVSGILQVSVVLSILAMFLVPISCVILAVVFFRDSEHAEFV